MASMQMGMLSRLCVKAPGCRDAAEGSAEMPGLMAGHLFFCRCIGRTIA
jgi:hypothetical protein